MIYLTGAWRRSQVLKLADMGIGAMLQPRAGGLSTVESFPCWAADNGCFAAGERFVLDKFYAWLDRVPRARCLFATAPDVFPDAMATLARSLPVLPVLRSRGFKAAFVLQNGATELPWSALDVLFIGGDDEWKLGAAARDYVAEARARSKWVHMGRVNSERRLRYAATIGCQSADGTFLKFRNRIGDGTDDLRKWLRQGLLCLR